MTNHSAILAVVAAAFVVAGHDRGNSSQASERHDGIVWGAQGQPLSSAQLDTVSTEFDIASSYGATSYRVIVSSVEQTDNLRAVIAAAHARAMTILPVLVPPIDPKNSDTADIYQKSREFAIHFASRFSRTVRVWELGNILDPRALSQQCALNEKSKVLTCGGNLATGTAQPKTNGQDEKRLIASLQGLSDGITVVDPDLRTAVAAASHNEPGAFERLQQAGIRWDISALRISSDNPETELKRIAAHGRSIWVTELNYVSGLRHDDIISHALRLRQQIRIIKNLKSDLKIDAVYINQFAGPVPSSAPPANSAATAAANAPGASPGDTGDKRSPAHCVSRTLILGGYRLANASMVAPAVPASTPAVASSSPTTAPTAEQSLAIPKRSCNLCFFKPQNATATNIIDYSYCLILGRAPDPLGKSNYIKDISAGTSISNVLTSMASSDEFKNKYRIPELATSAYVTLIYRLLLDRNPDGGGYHAYVANIESKQMTSFNLIEQFIHSDEFKSQHPLLFKN